VILIITHKEDYTADFVVDKLNKKKIDYFRFNTEDSFEKDLTEISFEKKKNVVEINNRKKFNSVWFRRVKLPISKNLDEDFINYYAKESEIYFKNLWTVLNARWLSNPFNVYLAEHKLLQLKCAQKIGFNIPKTLVTTNFTSIKKFFNKNNNNIIIKPIYSGNFYSSIGKQTVFTSKVDQEDISKLENSIKCPSIFQENISKYLEIRVTVINNKVYSSSVDSKNTPNAQIDWRKGEVKFKRYKLPSKVEDLCIKLVNKFKLKFGAIDLILKENGEYIFLEINPNGQWAWIEMETGLPISNEIIKFLENK